MTHIVSRLRALVMKDVRAMPGYRRRDREVVTQTLWTLHKAGHLRAEPEEQSDCPGSGGSVYPYEGPQFGRHMVEEPCERCHKFHPPRGGEHRSGDDGPAGPPF